MSFRRCADAGRILSTWGPAIGMMTIIFLVSGMSSPPTPTALPDVGAHAMAYALLGASFLRGVADARWEQVTARTTTVAVLLTVAYGLSDEFHQSFVPGRTSEVSDLVADACGAVVGVGGVWAWSIVLADRRAR